MKRIINTILFTLLITIPLYGQGMDFTSGDQLEFKKKQEIKKLSDEDRAREAEEAKTLSEEEPPSRIKKRGIRADIIRRESKPRQRKVFFHFLSPQIDAGYRYMGSYDFSNNHLLMLSGNVTLLGLFLERFEGYVGQIGYQLAQKGGFKAFTLTPVAAAFRWRIKNNWRPLMRHVTYFNIALECSILTFTILQNHLTTKEGNGMGYLLSYFTLKGRYDLHRTRNLSWNLYLSLSIGPEDVDNQERGTGVVFSLGFSGNFYPLMIQLKEK